MTPEKYQSYNFANKIFKDHMDHGLKIRHIGECKLLSILRRPLFSESSCLRHLEGLPLGQIAVEIVHILVVL